MAPILPFWKPTLAHSEDFFLKSLDGHRREMVSSQKLQQEFHKPFLDLPSSWQVAMFRPAPVLPPLAVSTCLFSQKQVLLSTVFDKGQYHFTDEALAGFMGSALRPRMKVTLQNASSTCSTYHHLQSTLSYEKEAWQEKHLQMGVVS